MSRPDIDDTHLRAVYDDPSQYWLSGSDLALLEEYFRFSSAYIRDDLARYHYHDLLRIQLATTSLYLSSLSEEGEEPPPG